MSVNYNDNNLGTASVGSISDIFTVNQYIRDMLGFGNLSLAESLAVCHMTWHDAFKSFMPDRVTRLPDEKYSYTCNEANDKAFHDSEALYYSRFTINGKRYTLPIYVAGTYDLEDRKVNLVFLETCVTLIFAGVYTEGIVVDIYCSTGDDEDESDCLFVKQFVTREYNKYDNSFSNLYDFESPVYAFEFMMRFNEIDNEVGQAVINLASTCTDLGYTYRLLTSEIRDSFDRCIKNTVLVNPEIMFIS